LGILFQVTQSFPLTLRRAPSFMSSSCFPFDRTHGVSGNLATPYCFQLLPLSFALLRGRPGLSSVCGSSFDIKHAALGGGVRFPLGNPLMVLIFRTSTFKYKYDLFLYSSGWRKGHTLFTPISCRWGETSFPSDDLLVETFATFFSA